MHSYSTLTFSYVSPPHQKKWSCWWAGHRHRHRHRRHHVHDIDAARTRSSDISRPGQRRTRTLHSIIPSTSYRLNDKVENNLSWIFYTGHSIIRCSAQAPLVQELHRRFGRVETIRPFAQMGRKRPQIITPPPRFYPFSTLFPREVMGRQMEHSVRPPARTMESDTHCVELCWVGLGGDEKGEKA